MRRADDGAKAHVASTRNRDKTRIEEKRFPRHFASRGSYRRYILVKLTPSYNYLPSGTVWNVQTYKVRSMYLIMIL